MNNPYKLDFEDKKVDISYREGYLNYEEGDLNDKEGEIHINEQLICILGKEYSISEEDLNFLFEELIFIMNNNYHKFNENKYQNIPIIEAIPLIVDIAILKAFISQIEPDYDKNLGEKINGFLKRMVEQEILKPEIIEQTKNSIINVLNGKK